MLSRVVVGENARGAIDVGWLTLAWHDTASNVELATLDLTCDRKPFRLLMPSSLA